MSVVTSAILDAAALLLVASGLAKLRSPATTARAMRALGWGLSSLSLGGGRLAARSLGVAEIAVGVLTVAIGGRWSPVLVAAMFLAFGLAALRLRSVAPHEGCGCFGAASAPVGIAHLAICASGAVLGMAAAVVGAHPIGSLLHDGIAVGVTTMVLVALLAALGYLAMTSAATLATLRRAA